MMKLVAIGLSVLVGAGIGFMTTREARAQTGDRRFELRTLLGTGSRIGISVRDAEANDVAAAGLDRLGGVVVESVTDDSPAARSGLRTGDFISTFDGERVRSVSQFRRLVQETPAGRQTDMSLIRDGSRQTVEITPEANADARGLADIMRSIERNLRNIPRRFDPDLDAQSQSPPFRPLRLGVVLLPLSDQLRTFFGVEGGVLVSEIDAGSPAAEGGLHAGDVITHIGGAAVNSSADVVRAVARANPGTTLEIAVVRDGEKLTLRATLPGRGGRQPLPQPA